MTACSSLHDLSRSMLSWCLEDSTEWWSGVCFGDLGVLVGDGAVVCQSAIQRPYLLHAIPRLGLHACLPVPAAGRYICVVICTASQNAAVWLVLTLAQELETPNGWLSHTPCTADLASILLPPIFALQFLFVASAGGLQCARLSAGTATHKSRHIFLASTPFHSSLSPTSSNSSAPVTTSRTVNVPHISGQDRTPPARLWPHHATAPHSWRAAANSTTCRPEEVSCIGVVTTRPQNSTMSPTTQHPESTEEHRPSQSTNNCSCCCHTAPRVMQRLRPAAPAQEARRCLALVAG